MVAVGTEALSGWRAGRRHRPASEEVCVRGTGTGGFVTGGGWGSREWSETWQVQLQAKVWGG